MANGSSMIAVLSDIHIGTDENTCWYQTKDHEPYLVAALEFIADQGMFQELVLLGDLVDTWTYAPSVKPPTMTDIIAKNQNVLGSSGALAKVVKAVPKVTYLLGNHDGTLTPADIAALQNSVGAVQMVDQVHVLTGSSGKKTVFTHGHYWTMFNAPDQTSDAPWKPLPVGHFVTRAFSYMMAKQLQGTNKTVADFPNMGYPQGFNLWDFLWALFSTFPAVPDIASLLLNYVLKESNGMTDQDQIILPGGATTTIADVRPHYANLFDDWVNKEGSVKNAGRAALADSSGEWLAWFAQKVAIEQSADLVVMGHTHTPVGGLGISPINYFNNGYQCASVPDMLRPTNPAMFNFTAVDLDQPTAELFLVKPNGYDVDLATVPALPSAVIQPPALGDFSSFVRIVNKSGRDLTLTASGASQGYWVVPPPKTIKAGGRGDCWLQDNVGAEGSAGTFSYQGAGDFSVSCPFGASPNTVSGAGGNFVAKSGTGDWLSKGSVPSWQHPLQVIFTVGG
jgi:UDP-2,3-diacylglucosamine pyrophosphatase LpxH